LPGRRQKAEGRSRREGEKVRRCEMERQKKKLKNYGIKEWEKEDLKL
jgi:hypothetical protein